LALAFRVFTHPQTQRRLLHPFYGDRTGRGATAQPAGDPSASVGPLLLWLDVSLSERECVSIVPKIHAVSAVILAPTIMSLLLLDRNRPARR
jgi:hypothetical protein